MSKILTAFFTNRGQPALGLTPTVTVYKLDPTDPNNSTVAASGPAVEVGGGFYRFDFSQYNPLENYTYVFDGGSTLRAGERYVYGGNESYIEEIVKQVWATSITTDTTPAGSFGELIANYGSQLAYISSVVEILLKYQNNRSLIDPATKTLTIFDDDGVTPLITFNLYDRFQRPSVDEVYEKVPV